MDRTLQLPREENELRVKRTQSLLADRGLRGLIAISCGKERQGHVRYLANHVVSLAGVLDRFPVVHSAFVLPSKRPGMLVCPPRYEPGQTFGAASTKAGYDFGRDLIAALKETALTHGRVGIAGTDVLPVEIYLSLMEALPEVSFEKANELLESQQIVKSSEEVALLRGGARIARLGLQAGIEMAREGVGNYEVELAVRKEVMEAGAEAISHVSALPHLPHTRRTPRATSQMLGKGDLVCLEVAGWFAGYAFTESRVAVVGDPSDAQKDFLEHLQEATDWMISLLAPDKQVRFVYTQSRARIIVPFGHGIGLELRENPLVSLGKAFTPCLGMVLSIKPIVVSQELGAMAITKTVSITDDGLDVLQ